MSDFLAFQRAYGLQGRTMMACEILGGSTAFARAVRYFGPMFAYYDRRRKRWTLFGRITTHQRIIDTARARMQRAAG